MKKTLIFTLLSFSILTTKASHLIGGELTYRCIGSSNAYEIILTVYRDCSGIPLANPTENVTVNSTCGSFTAVLNEIDLSPGDPTTTGMKDVSYVCPDLANSTTCDPGGTYPGIEAYQWRGVVTLTPCSDWTFDWDQNARNPAFNYPTTNDCGQSFPNAFVRTLNAASEELRLISTLNNADSSCNGSPVFNATPRIFLCQGVANLIDHGGVDPDGDSLSYELIAPLVGNSGAQVDTLGYNLGFSSQHPISVASGTTFDIDINTGQMNITPRYFGIECSNPDSLEQSSIAILISQYRNGTLVGTTIRDVQILTLPICDQLNATFQGIYSLGSATLLNNDTIEVQAGDTLDFTVQVNDFINKDSFMLTNSLKQQIPALNFTYYPFTYIYIVHGRTILPTNSSHVGIYNFNINALNDGCPIAINYQFPMVLQVLPSASTSIAKDLESSVKIFPNPTNGKLNIELNEMTNNANISILDITGKELYHQTIHTNKTSMDLNVPSGVYFVRIATDKQTEVKKIIVEPS